MEATHDAFVVRPEFGDDTARAGLAIWRRALRTVNLWRTRRRQSGPRCTQEDDKGDDELGDDNTNKTDAKTMPSQTPKSETANHRPAEDDYDEEDDEEPHDGQDPHGQQARDGPFEELPQDRAAGGRMGKHESRGGACQTYPNPTQHNHTHARTRMHADTNKKHRHSSPTRISRDNITRATPPRQQPLFRKHRTIQQQCMGNTGMGVRGALGAKRRTRQPDDDKRQRRPRGRRYDTTTGL